MQMECIICIHIYQFFYLKQDNIKQDKMVKNKMIWIAVCEKLYRKLYRLKDYIIYYIKINYYISYII